MAIHNRSMLLLTATTLVAAQPTVVITDGHIARRFDGIGAISGGGATSRLLFDYPATQQAAILDVLFKPGYAAGLQHLKVEIPGDADTTCGSEVSHRHSASDPGSFMRGYEFWLLRQAKDRNPNLTTSALQWAAPRFVSEGQESLLTGTDIQYVLSWLEGARTHWNVSIDFMGAGWNEHAYSPSYVLALRQALDAAGLPLSSTLLTAADEWYPPHCWQVAYDMAANVSLRNAIHAISMHVAGVLEHDDPTPQVALDLGVPIWQGEEHIGLPDPAATPVWEWAGAASVGIEINQNWVLNNMSSTVFWPVAYSWYSGIIYRGKGFVVATSPWGSSPFTIPAAVWVVAHTTMFAPAGWMLLNRTGSGHAPGTVGNNVSYVTYVSPAANPATGSRDITIVIESFFQGPYHRDDITAPLAPTTIRFQLGGGLSPFAGTALHVWHTNISETFHRLADVVVDAQGAFSVTIEPSAIITVTSVAVDHPGGDAVMADLVEHSGAVAYHAAPGAHGRLGDGPEDDAFPLPYADDFEHYGNDSLPLYFSDMFGAFTTHTRSTGSSDNAPIIPGALPHPLSPYPKEAVHLPCHGPEEVALRPQRCTPGGSSNANSNGYVLRQAVYEPPIGWLSDAALMSTIIGSFTWLNISVSVLALIEVSPAGHLSSTAAPPPSVFLGVRGSSGGLGETSPNVFYKAPVGAYAFHVDVTGSWKLSSGKVTLSNGTLATPYGYDTWRAISLSASNSEDGKRAQVVASIDGVAISNVTDTAPRGPGYAILGTGLNCAQFDNFAVAPV